MNADAIFDLLVACVLVASTAYIFILNKKISFIWNSRNEFQKLLSEFIKATERAEERLAKLQKDEEGLRQEVERKLADVNTATSELSFFLDRGKLLAAQLEQDVREGRDSRKDKDPSLRGDKKYPQSHTLPDGLVRNVMRAR